MSYRKNVILGVTAGIAVYKSADLCSKLNAEGYDVRVIMTPNSLELISTRIFATLSGNPVLTDLFNDADPRPMHVALAKEADLMIVAPATANFIGKLAHGIADDALTSTALAFRGKMLIAPAMNSDMLASPAVQDNLALLRSRGVLTIGPDSGHLACGKPGAGRMTEPADILAAVKELLA